MIERFSLFQNYGGGAVVLLKQRIDTLFSTLLPPQSSKLLSLILLHNYVSINLDSIDQQVSNHPI